MTFHQHQTFKVRVGVVVLDGENRLLLSRQNKRPFWVLPGGTLEPEETMAQCAVREIKEEVNLDVSEPRLLFVADFFPSPDRHVIDVVFYADLLGGRFEPETTENIDEIRFFLLDEAEAIETRPQCLFEQVLACWRQNQWPPHGRYIGSYS